MEKNKLIAQTVNSLFENALKTNYGFLETLHYSVLDYVSKDITKSIDDGTLSQDQLDNIVKTDVNKMTKEELNRIIVNGIDTIIGNAITGMIPTG